VNSNYVNILDNFSSLVARIPRS